MDELRIRQLLGSELAQDDPHFEVYAIDREDLLATLGDPERRFVIINAPRGCGKSGLLLKHRKNLELASPTSNVVIRKFLKNLHYPSTVAGLEGAIQFWKRQLLEWMVEEIGRRIQIPMNEDEATAVEFVERAGYRHRPKVAGDATRLEVPDAALEAIVVNSALRFWILLDEMDDHFDGTLYIRHRLGGLLAACKDMLDLRQVWFRVTVRPHIMTLLKTHYDHVQQLRQYEMGLTWKADQLKKILARRIAFFEQNYETGQMDLLTSPMSTDSEGSTNTIISRHFADFDMSLSAGSKSRYRAFHTVSLGRPRWMLEFCALALSMTPKERVGSIEYKKAMDVFGNNRIQFLAGEHRYYAPQLEALINGLSGARKTIFKTSTAFRMAIEEFVLHVEPMQRRKPDDPVVEQALEIARLLFMVEFIRARQGDGRNYRFFSYVDRPSLLASWNTEANISWELHPTFARGLQIVDNNTFRVGDQVRVFGERASLDDEPTA